MHQSRTGLQHQLDALELFQPLPNVLSVQVVGSSDTDRTRWTLHCGNLCSVGGQCAIPETPALVPVLGHEYSHRNARTTANGEFVHQGGVQRTGTVGMRRVLNESQIDARRDFRKSRKDRAGVGAVATPGAGYAEYPHLSLEPAQQFLLVLRQCNLFIHSVPTRTLLVGRVVGQVTGIGERLLEGWIEIVRHDGRFRVLRPDPSQGEARRPGEGEAPCALETLKRGGIAESRLNSPTAGDGLPGNTAKEAASVKVRDIMKRHPVVVKPDTRVRDVLQTMVSHRVTGVSVVTDDGRMLGFIPERNLIVRELLAKGKLRPATAGRDFREFISQQRHLYGKTAEDVMNREVVTISEFADVLDALECMLDNNVSRLPVVDHDRIVGELSRTDVLSHLLALEYEREGLHEEEEKDVDLANRVHEAIHHQTHISPVKLHLEVSNHVVYLHGIVSAREDIQFLVDLVSQIPGVRNVVNSLLVEQLTR